MNRCSLLVYSVLLLSACSSVTPRTDPALLKEQVTAAEVAFAKTMADRDLAAFSRLISDEAVFVNRGKAIRGKEAISAAWKGFYDSPRAPFSWKPDLVEVLPSGVLAYSTGPVMNPDGVLIARFNSIWRLEAPGQWRVVFDHGSEVCNCPKP
ncbi:MAG: nuclear transport factor 2 family protein [Burkholderiaceae bacterium]|nr:nuclear transport factor 2 family protein [Burkholderiaceae bacterium]